MRSKAERYLTFVNHGARVRVGVNAANAFDRVRLALPFGSQIRRTRRPDASFRLFVAEGTATRGATHRLYRGSLLLQSSRRLEPLLERLGSELHFTVASYARSALFVHAGVVGWRGRAILLPGRSMTGKTSLVAALVRAGADYLSDEYAVVDARGRIHPFPKPIGIRLPGGETRQTAPESIGGTVGRRPLRAGLIVATRYVRGVRFEPTVRTASRGLMVLIANAVVVRERPRFALDRLARIAGDASTLEGTRGEAHRAAAWLLRQMG
jgi:hypothetical protein